MIQECTSNVLRGREVREAFTSEWDEAAWANPRATIFQTGGWYEAWTETVAVHEHAEPLILRIFSAGRMRAALALQISREPSATIRPLSWPWADYHEGLGNPFDVEAIEVLAQALRELMAKEQCPLVLDDVIPGGILERAIRRLPAERSESSTTVAIDLTDSAHKEHLIGRKEYLVKSRRLERLGKVSCRHHSEPGEIKRRMRAFVEMHRRRWSGRPDAVAPFDGGIIDAAFAAIVRHLAPRGLLLLTELALGGIPIAMYFGFTYGCRYGGYRTAFDEEHRRLSPGHLMLQRMIVDLSAAGFHELDLMRGAYLYKNDYASRRRRNLRFEVSEL